VCREAGFDCLNVVTYDKGQGEALNYRVYARDPKVIAEGLTELVFGEKMEV
jgi:hypothetical protein